jgi:hypothetical protein
MGFVMLLNLYLLRGGLFRVVALVLIAGLLGIVGLGIWSLEASQPQPTHTHHAAHRAAR